MRAEIKLLVYLTLGLLSADLSGRGPQKFTAPEQVILWSASGIIGPVYFPAQAEPDSPVRQTAEDMAQLLEQMSGHSWPVAPEPTNELTANGIFIGDTHRARLDGVYGTKDGRPVTGMSRRALLDSGSWERTEVLLNSYRLVINGTTPEATRSGVYYFLQQELNCFWAQPGPVGERLPRRERVSLRPGLSAYQPDFYDRHFLLGKQLKSTNPDSLWALRLGASAHFDFNHNLFRVFSPKVMAEQEAWRAWRFGERVPVSDVNGSGSQPDLLNEEVVEFTVDHVNRLAQKDSDRMTFSLATNDSVRYDDNIATRELLMPWHYFRGKPNYSNLVFGFTNEVAERSESNDSPYLSQLAYMWTERPPDFAVNARVMPYICTDQSQWYDPNYRAEDKELIEAWGTVGPRMLGVWEYYQGQPYMIPRYFPTIMANSLDWCARHGGRGIFFSGYPVWGYDAPKYWLAGQLAWQADLDHAYLLSEYFERAYGLAAEPMSAFFNECEAAWMEQPGEGMWLKYWDNPDQFSLFGSNRRILMSQLLEQASQLASEIADPLVRVKVKSLIEQTRGAWRITCAGAELYDAWRAIPYPGDAELPTAEQFSAFELALDAWQSTDKQLFDRAGSIISFISQLDPEERWRSRWTSVLTESFEEPVFVGDLMGAGPETLAPKNYLRQWVTMFSHAEGFSVKRSTLAGNYLRVVGADYFNFYRWLEIQPGVIGDFRLAVRLRGRISPGSQAEINLYFMDHQGEFTPLKTDRLYPAEFKDWVVLAVAEAIPPEATHVCAGVRISDQFESDWIEIGEIDLQYRAPVFDTGITFD